MSRHRNIRNLTADAEYDNDYDEEYGDEYEEVPELTDEQEEDMQLAMVKVRSLLDDSTAFTDAKIRETLWYYYFDVDQAVDWLLQEQAKMNKKAATTSAAKSKSNTTGKASTSSVQKGAKQATPTAQKPFKFDRPSPDDVVLAAQSQRGRNQGDS
ncbi:HBS1 N-terminus-domain-containing protein [Syncephalis plumigaleata]|nr:HBS1 N-terminus-domain-containing protein [Syncephalis plumigaleata]